MKLFFKRHIAGLKESGLWNDGRLFISWSISLILLAYVVALLASSVYVTSAHKGIVFATDNDGGRAIETSMATRWYNSNHFAAYGNLYYRLSHSLADLINAPTTKNLSALESWEYSHTLSLKLISLFSLLAFGLFLGWTYFGITPLMPLFGSLWLLISTHIPMWSKWIFRPHPEHLLLLTTGVAVYAFGKFLCNKESRKLFILSAIMWGITMSVKRSTAIFIPGCILLILLPWKKENLKLLLEYIGYMLAAYLIIGFPQNFGFYKHIKFLLYESSLHKIGDAESMSINLNLILGQLKYTVPLILAATFFSHRRERTFSWKLVLFVLIAFVPIMLRKMSFLGDHHTMPLAISCLIVFSFGFLHFNSYRLRKFTAAAAFILMVVSMKLIGIGGAFFEAQREQMVCLTDIEHIIQIIDGQVSSEKKLFKEPSFPFNEKISKFTTTQWGLDWSKVTTETYLLGINVGSYTDYNLVKPIYFYGKMLEDWDIKSQFYRELKGKTEVTSPTGIRFKKTHSACGFELWSRENTNATGKSPDASS